ncbi:MAG: hypothetical protein C5S48_10150 [Candidatus Methanogaster sp.]|nr:MAG: hypothetical protein C5S48_10150 [ANME-2 cluster archaeon]
MDVYNLEEKEENDWDAFISAMENATFYHQIGWKSVIEKTYKHKPYYLVAKEDGNIKGVLPLFLIASVIFGKKLVSIPFAPYGGVCGDDFEAENMLMIEAKRIAKITKSKYIELRNQNEKSRLLTNSTYVTFHIPLNVGSEVLWKRTSKGARRSTKKAIRNNIEVLMGLRYLDDFYEMYAIRNNELGSPVHSYHFFKNILKEFPTQSNIQVAKFKDKIIGGKFLLFFRGTITSGWASSDRRYKEYNPNNILTWELIKYGCNNKYSCFDFGRSEWNSGTFRFKKAWAGSVIKPLYYQFYIPGSGEPPDFTQSSPMRQKFAMVWKRLPLSMTKAVGPIMRRNFP